MVPREEGFAPRVETPAEEALAELDVDDPGLPLPQTHVPKVRGLFVLFFRDTTYMYVFYYFFCSNLP